ncbi:hypothetical protein [Dokdonia sp.]|uniref:hypothetical protein n=1 Tax=Dokdonia sp. TaxID=2024995 RepID=UPI003267B4AD
MEKVIKSVLFFLIKLIIITPILLLVTFLILIFYLIIGVIIVPVQVIRYIGLTTLAAIQSAFANKDYTNVFLDALFEFCKKYLLFFGQIFYIPMAIWIPADENPSKLADILEYEWKVLSKNWIWTVLTYLALIISFTITFSSFGLKALDYSNLKKVEKKEKEKEKEKIYNDLNEVAKKDNSDSKTNQSLIDSISYKNSKKLKKITENNEKQIDSLNNVIGIITKYKSDDLRKIKNLQNKIKSLKFENQNIKNSTKIINPYSITVNQMLGKWEVVNENATWTISQNGKVYRVYNKNIKTNFTWNINDGILRLGNNNNWLIKSYINNKIELYHLESGRTRTIRKI